MTYCRSCCWATLLGAVAALFGFSVILNGWPVLNSAAAAWVQAIGSIVGIFVAIFASLWQSSKALDLYLTAERDKDNRERERYQKEVLAFPLMVWRMSAVLEIYFLTLEKNKVIKIKRTGFRSIGGKRYLYQYSPDMFNNTDHNGRIVSLEIALRSFKEDPQSAYLIQGIISSLKGVDLLKFPYSAIAEQILIYVSSFIKFDHCLNVLDSGLKAKLTHGKVNYDQKKDIENFYESLINLANSGYSSFESIGDFISSLDHDTRTTD